MEPSKLVNVVDPDTQEVGSIPAHQLQYAVSQGFTPATEEQLSSFLRNQKYGGTGQQALTALEGAGQGVSFGLSTGLERALGVKPEDIQGRREENPVSHGMGEAAGIIGSALIPGVGEANVLERAGQAGAKALIPSAKGVYEAAEAVKAAKTGVTAAQEATGAATGLEETAQAMWNTKAANKGLESAQAALTASKEARPFLAKIGTPAAEQAIQFGLIQSGDEVSKMFSGTPGYENPAIAAETAITNIGLTGLLGGATGGAFGALSPLWKATIGQKAENFLGALKNRADGVTIPISESMESALKDIDIPPEIRAGLSDSPMMKEHFQTLIESGTQPGEALRETLAQFQGQVGEQLKSVFDTGERVSPFDAGEIAKNKILEKAEELNTGVRKNYDLVNADNEAIIIPDKGRLSFYDDLIKQGQEFGAAGSPSEALFKVYAERALAQDSIAQLDKLMTELGSDWSVARRAGDFEKARALGDIRESIRDFQDTQIGKAAELSAKGAASVDAQGAEAIGKQLVEQRKAARASYASFIEKIGEIASAGKLGSVKSFGQFQEALEKVPSAKLAEKLFDKKNIESLTFLKAEFPEVFEALVKQRKADILEASTRGGDLLHNSLLKKVSDLSPEVKALMFSPEELNTIEASGKILRQSKVRMNPSGTARGLDTLWKHMPAGVAGIVSLLTGHNPVAGILLGEAGKFLSRDAPDAIKLSLLKFLGSTGPVDGEAWKVASDFIHHAYKGQKTIDAVSKNVFKAEGEVLPKALFPSENDRERLYKKLEKLKTAQDPLLNVGGKTAHYLPDQGMAIGQIAANTTNYLNSLRPNLDKKNPLDSEIKESPMQKSAYNRVLDIAEQPLIVLSDIKDGTIVPQDVVHLKTMYPALYTQLSQKLMGNMIEVVSDGESIPYKTRLGLSLFLGQPLDSTMTPEALIALNPMPQTTQQPGAMKKSSHSSMKDLGKIGKSYMTVGQGREAKKSMEG